MPHQVDTLLCNKERLAMWQANTAYDYNRQLFEPDRNVFEWLMNEFGRFLENLFGAVFAERYTGWVIIAIFVLAALWLLWFLIKKKSSLFARSSAKGIDYSVHEDTIYGIDFEAAIADALRKGDYREVIRFFYLKALKELNDSQVINWQLYKTPTEYIYELPPGSGRETFRQFTNRFLRVRYGNFAASEPLFEEMRNLWAQMKGGDKI